MGDTVPTVALAALLWVLVTAGSAAGEPAAWKAEWPKTDFAVTAVRFDEILLGGPPKDGIPAIDDPRFEPAADVGNLADTEPVIGLAVNGEAKAYPLRVLTWHEIVNDRIGGVPVAVTYCPLCNAAIVFDRRLDGRILDFGTTGKLRNSDLVMYDRQTESWWQQFTGEAIVGDMTGARLDKLPARLESWERFRQRRPDGKVLVPTDPALRPYGDNPYPYYDSVGAPFFYRGTLPAGIPPMMRVVVVGNQAWTLPLVRSAGRIEAGGFTLRWHPGQSSALDAPRIAQARDIGNVVVQKGEGAAAEDVVHEVTFAFVFHAFHPDGTIHGR
jgi:hypothetical protein